MTLNKKKKQRNQETLKVNHKKEKPIRQVDIKY